MKNRNGWHGLTEIATKPDKSRGLAIKFGKAFFLPLGGKGLHTLLTFTACAIGLSEWQMCVEAVRTTRSGSYTIKLILKSKDFHFYQWKLFTFRPLQKI